MKFQYLSLCFSGLVVLTACSEAPEGAAERDSAAAPAASAVADFAASYQCGDETVGWSGQGETSTLEARGETFDLRQAVTASGAKHEAPDDAGTWIWNKGDKATVSIRGVQLDECENAESAAENSSEAAFRARGNEPGWMLTIADGVLTLISNYGETTITTAAPAPEIDGAVTRYALPVEGLTVVVTEKICSDDATDMPHPYAVTVETAGQTLNGCGGEPSSLLTGGEWVVEDIGGGGVIDNSRASLDFGDDRVAGSGSCNSYSAAYALSGEGLALGPTMATKRACPEALVNQEQKFFNILQKISRFEINETGALILISDDGGRILARRADG
jgi:heat shock protein HslJ/membrane-bound inhibitor of C-type lysozyme